MHYYACKLFLSNQGLFMKNYILLFQFTLFSCNMEIKKRKFVIFILHLLTFTFGIKKSILLSEVIESLPQTLMF